MKFEKFPYERPQMEAFTNSFSKLLEKFESAASFEEQSFVFEHINEKRTDFTSMYNICHIRHTIDTTDKFYEEENDFFDSHMPGFQALNTRFYRKLLASPFFKELENKWGGQIFVIAGLSLKTFKPLILEDLQQENKLNTEYIKLKAGAKIPFEGEQYNLSSIQTLEISEDRDRRKAAGEAKWDFYARHSGQVDGIFDKLVRLRQNIAQKLGYNSFVDLGYARMQRSDYDAVMVANFRKQVEEHIVPIATELYQRQARRLGIEKLKFYDEEFRFASGNPKPQGNPERIIEKAARMYAELSPETEAFFNFMRKYNLMDLEAKDGKATGGYCAYIGNFKAPYIFSNFNGTSGDIDVLTHEAGHAFQVYSSRNIGINEYNWPTYEACEIHSMSMEFFTWPWMELFFAEDAGKYKFSHLANAICFLPYGVAVDEFQHLVYEKPDMSPQQRKDSWRAIERKYLPQRDYDGHQFLEAGGFWHKQSHIFSTPFYYIDYTLAQICAFQFWKKDRENHRQAWKDYIRLCQAGGSKSFLELVELAGLRSPFEDGCVKSVTGTIKDWLDSVDDVAF